ncbi:MAG: hypothetical protein SGCHY_002319 [Lobulomycetales sp.]
MMFIQTFLAILSMPPLVIGAMGADFQDCSMTTSVVKINELDISPHPFVEGVPIVIGMCELLPSLLDVDFALRAAVFPLDAQLHIKFPTLDMVFNFELCDVAKKYVSNDADVVTRDADHQQLLENLSKLPFILEGVNGKGRTFRNIPSLDSIGSQAQLFCVKGEIAFSDISRSKGFPTEDKKDVPLLSDAPTKTETPSFGPAGITDAPAKTETPSLGPAGITETATETETPSLGPGEWPVNTETEPATSYYSYSTEVPTMDEMDEDEMER